MVDHSEESSVTEQFVEKPRNFSPSDSEGEKAEPLPADEGKVYRLFGSEKPLHHVLGGGKYADVILWRDKKISAAVLTGATGIWILFEFVGCRLLTLVCHGLVFSLAILFLWSKSNRLDDYFFFRMRHA